jgi:Na+/H+ antiporter NhaD/arsenite permease-like protein
MELQQIVALTLVLVVYIVSASRVVHRAAAALLGALVAVAFWGLPSIVGTVVPEVFLVTAGLMVLTTYVRRAGIASWLALKAAKAGSGRPNRILVLTGLHTFFLGALLVPWPPWPWSSPWHCCWP